MRSNLEQKNILAAAVHTAQPDDLTAATVDTAFLLDAGSTISIEAQKETNRNELTGNEEGDDLYTLGFGAKATLKFAKTQPHHLAFGLGFGLGNITKAAAGTLGNLFTIVGMTGSRNPLTTLVQRYGDTILKRRILAAVVDGLTLSLADGWATSSIDLVASGNFEDNVKTALIAGTDDDVSITLADAVQGATAAERLDNVHAVETTLSTGETVLTPCTAVSSGPAATLTIVAPGAGNGVCSHRVVYVPTEPAWATLPPRIKESPLRVTDFLIRRNGHLVGNALSGGIPLAADFQSFEYKLANSQEFATHPKDSESSLGIPTLYKGYEGRGGRVQTISLGRQFRDFALQSHFLAGDFLSLHLVAVGPEYEPGHAYRVEAFFPKCAILQAPIDAANKRLGEKGDLECLADANGVASKWFITTTLPALAGV